MGRKLVLRGLVVMVVGWSAILALPTGAAAVPAWVPAQNVREPVREPESITGVELAGDAAGNTIAVWTRLDTKGDSSPANDVSVIETAFRPAGGSFGAPQVISGNELTSPPRGATSPDVGMDELGRALVVWRYDSGTNSALRARVRGADGTFGAISDLSAIEAGNDVALPQVAVNAAGQAAVVWERQSPNQVYATTGAIGGGFAAPSPISATGVPIVGATVAIDAAGNAIFAWGRHVSAVRWLVEARPKPASGAFGPVALLSPDQDYKLAGYPRVGFDPAGRATVVWEFLDQDPDNDLDPGNDTDTSVIRFATRSVSPDWAGGSFSPAGTIPAVATVSNIRPDVAVDASGNAVVIWTGTLGGHAIVQSASRPSGGSFGSPQTVSGPGLDVVGSALTMGPAGDAVVAWLAMAGSTGVAQAARRPAGPASMFGAVDEDVDRLTPPAGGFAVFDGRPGLATDSEGNVIGAWRGLSCTPAPVVCESSARFAAFDAAPPTLTSVTVPGSATAGQPVAMSATTFDRISGASIGWAFGDGGGANGAAASHVFGAPGPFNVTVTASDAVGNASSQTRAIQVSGPPATPAGLVKGSVVFRARPARRHTTFRSLFVRGATSRGSRVRVTCRGSRRCPFGRRGRTFTPRRGKVTLTRAFRRRKLRPGTAIDVRISAPGLIGKVLRIKVRRARAPKRTTLCLPPGAARPQRRC